MRPRARKNPRLTAPYMPSSWRTSLIKPGWAASHSDVPSLEPPSTDESPPPSVGAPGAFKTERPDTSAPTAYRKFEGFVLQILIETKPGLPAEWRDYARSNHLRVAALPSRAALN